MKKKLRFFTSPTLRVEEREKPPISLREGGNIRKSENRGDPTHYFSGLAMASFDYKKLGDLGLQKARDGLLKNRQEFWKNNMENFPKNVKYLADKIGYPEGWKIYILTGEFVSDKEIHPYEPDCWSEVFITSASASEYERGILLYLNSAKSFLSISGVLFLVAHEMVHISQAAKNPETYLKSLLSDEGGKVQEQEAESEIMSLDKEFIKQYVLEHIVYCHDKWGWDDAEKMADFFFRKRANMWCGGYKNLMDEKEFALFQDAKLKNDILLFIKKYIQM
ncbi:hypothetical protein L6303_04750 [archaeon]|nr:hypothetical protein [Nanoarchaeota archaeon]MCG2724028.1 hypothetical protein [archaeon]